MVCRASFSARFPDESSCVAHLERVTGDQFRRSDSLALGRNPKLSGRRASVQLLALSAAVSNIPLIVWFHAFYLLASARFGLPSAFLERYFGLGAAEVRELMRGFNLCLGPIAVVEPFDGSRPVQVDETLLKCRIDSGADYRGVTILGMSDQERVLAWPVADRTRATLIPLILANVPRCTEIYTDGWKAYRILPRLGYEHRYVRHNRNEWVSGSGANTFAIDSFWAYLKRMIRLARGELDRFDLDSCLLEARVRFSHRQNPAGLLESVLSV